MTVSYKRLFHLLIDKGVTIAELMDNAALAQPLLPN